jgi:hypothetical protein
MPRKAGEIASFNEAFVALNASGFANMGLPANAISSVSVDAIGSGLPIGASGGTMSASSNVQISGVATGEKVLSGSGSADLSVNTTGLLTASFSTAGSSVITIDSIGSIGAIASSSGDASVSVSSIASGLPLSGNGLGAGSSTVSVSGLLLPYAIGNMSGSTTDGNVLTPTSVADAVWEKAIEAGLSAQELMRLISSVQFGTTEILTISPGEAIVTFKSIDGTEDRVVADMDNSTRVNVVLNGG